MFVEMHTDTIIIFLFYHLRFPRKCVTSGRRYVLRYVCKMRFSYSAETKAHL